MPKMIVKSIIGNTDEVETCRPLCICDTNGVQCDSNDAIVSPNYPKKYPLDMQCSHQISVEEGKFIIVEFLHFEVKNSYTI